MILDHIVYLVSEVLNEPTDYLFLGFPVILTIQ
jgi:hypothetical protein